MVTYADESIRLFDALKKNLPNFVGGTLFQIGDVSIQVEGRDGLGGLIEEWLGIWAIDRGFLVKSAKSLGQSQEFPDYYIGQNNHLLEIKCFDSDAGANFDLANFDSYCSSLALNPNRLFADYLIFSYSLSGSKLRITNVWLKKIWEITCRSQRYPLKTQIKRGVMYNIRPASWYSKNSRFGVFYNWSEFAHALYDTEKMHHNINTSPNEVEFAHSVFSKYSLKYII